MGPLCSRSVLVEHPTNERTLPGRVEVVSAPVHRRVQRRRAEPQVRADGGHQDVTALDQRAHRAGTVDVGNRRFQAELGGKSSHTVAVTTGQQRPGTTLHEGASGQLTCVPGRSEHHDPAGHAHLLARVAPDRSPSASTSGCAAPQPFTSSEPISRTRVTTEMAWMRTARSEVVGRRPTRRAARVRSAAHRQSGLTSRPLGPHNECSGQLSGLTS